MAGANTSERKTSTGAGPIDFTTSKNNKQELGPSRTNNSLSGGDRDMGDRRRSYRTMNHRSSGVVTQGDNLGKGGNN